jgi:hypothetical protein
MLLKKYWNEGWKEILFSKRTNEMMAERFRSKMLKLNLFRQLKLGILCLKEEREKRDAIIISEFRRFQFKK